ncbi:MAG: hypothetical protein IPP48_12375 [Chitinophagaceae bacterium]|nr:hypothetical protein [Chitinophagaceae bacterium]
MITEKEKQFIIYWEKVRAQRAQFGNKLLSGLPMATLFSLPILLSVAVVYLFFPEWYTKVSNIPKTVFITVIIAVLISMLFFAYFRMHYKWEMNEQLYKELKHKLKKTATEL